MVVATDSGDIARAKVPPRAPGPLTAAARAAGLNDTELFEPHSGPASAVDASPFFRNVFLSCSSDGAIRLYSLLDMQHKLALVPSPETKHFLYGAAFSPARPGVIAACSRASQVHLYDLAQSRVKPAFTLDRAGSEDSAVLCLAWAGSGSFLATGDAKGCVRVWSIATALCETTELERAAVRHAERSSNTSAAAAGASAAGAGSSAKEGDPSFAVPALTQSMLLAGRGVAEHGAAASADPVQVLLGFTP